MDKICQSENFSCFFILIFLLFFFFFAKRIYTNEDDDEELIMRMRIVVEKPPPLILSWNKFFTYKNSMEMLLEQNNVSACPHRCRYSADRALEQNASVIIFHIRDSFGPLPAHRNGQQLYAFFLLESPIHSGGNHKTVPPDFFNISMTYRADSDVFLPYDAFDPIDDENDEFGGKERWTEEELEWKIGNKSKLAIQFVSNCRTNSGREKLVEELKRHMNVTEMGQCAGRHGCGGKCFEEMMDEHFFYLAFENSVCQNYVSEKFWNVKRLIVPVVLNRNVLANLSIPEGAFIAADDFGSPRELAEHLGKVAADKELYRRHFEWTKMFKRSEHRKGPGNGMCELCKLANEESRGRRRIIGNIVDWWERGQCQSGLAKQIAERGK